MSGDHNQYQKGCNHSWVYIGSKRQAAWQCSHCGRLALDNPNTKWTPRTERCYAPDGTLIHEKIQYVPDGEWHDISKEKQRMINARKLQYYTMAHRMRGFAEGLDEDRHEALVHMLMKAAMLLEEAWDDYQLTLPEDQRVGS